ncbi:hypothetical protein ES703_34232 [subsurface metagenome]
MPEGGGYTYYSPLDSISSDAVVFQMMVKRIWSAVCPFCGRSYKRSVWDLILRSRLRGILGYGQPVPCPGHRTIFKADVAAIDGAALDAALGAGLFSQFKVRMLAVIYNWLGNGWLDGADLRDMLNRIGKVRGGFPVANFGPGVAEGGCRLDVAVYAMGSEELDVVKRDDKIRTWG